MEFFTWFGGQRVGRTKSAVAVLLCGICSSAARAERGPERVSELVCPMKLKCFKVMKGMLRNVLVPRCTDRVLFADLRRSVRG